MNRRTNRMIEALSQKCNGSLRALSPVHPRKSSGRSSVSPPGGRLGHQNRGIGCLPRRAGGGPDSLRTQRGPDAEDDLPGSSSSAPHLSLPSGTFAKASRRKALRRLYAMRARPAVHATAVRVQGMIPGRGRRSRPYLSRSSPIYSAVNILFTPNVRKGRDQDAHPARRAEAAPPVAPSPCCARFHEQQTTRS